MILYGASGHSKVIYDCLKSQGIQLSAIYDDDFKKKEFLNFKIDGPYNSNLKVHVPLIIGIGNNEIRKRVSSGIIHKFGSIAHKTAIISPYARYGLGTVVFQGAIIQSDVKIGEHCIINTNASVDHDSTIGNFVHIGPNATICGNVAIGDGTLIGAGSTILPNLTIGKGVVIGAGSVVIKDVIDGSKIYGNPAK